jgi:ribonuclease P protein component
MSLRLPKAARLGRSGEFERVKREGVSYAGRYFVLGVLRVLPEEERPRIGLITSRRVGDSVTRHRARRRLRELFRVARPFVKGGLWLVLIARAAGARASFAALEAEWRVLGAKAGIFLEEVAG